MSSGFNCTTSVVEKGIVLLRVAGRLDAFSSKEFGERVSQALADPDVVALVFDLQGVNYLSSAAIRIFTVALKRLHQNNGILILFNLHEYCAQIFEISGLTPMFSIQQTEPEGLAIARSCTRQKELLRSWSSLETIETPLARIRFLPSSPQAKGVVEILGHVKEVLHADVTDKDVASKKFSETEYSIGCGGLGDQLEEYFPIMGEMITIGGTMVWLPTDGNDTPDFLIPRRSSVAVTIRTVFNASILGGFDEVAYMEAPNGIAIDQLYRTIFDAAKQRRGNFHGVIGIAGRAEFTEVYGAGIRKSPIRRFKPKNNETILHPSNIHEWFSGDREPRLRNVTGLLCGVGIDLTSDLSRFDPACVDAAFYRHPDNTAGKPHLLHNHAVFFTQQPFPEKPVSLTSEIQTVVENGDFIDMRHLLDQSLINRAFIGLSYTQEIRHTTN